MTTPRRSTRSACGSRLAGSRKASSRSPRRIWRTRLRFNPVTRTICLIGRPSPAMRRTVELVCWRRRNPSYKSLSAPVSRPGSMARNLPAPAQDCRVAVVRAPPRAVTRRKERCKDAPAPALSSRPSPCERTDAPRAGSRPAPSRASARRPTHPPSPARRTAPGPRSGRAPHTPRPRPGRAPRPPLTRPLSRHRARSRPTGPRAGSRVSIGFEA